MKIFPEKISTIKDHKTRKMITQNTLINKEIIGRASNFVENNRDANIKLKNSNIPYLKDTQVVLYSSNKIIVESKISILKSKINELHDQLIKELKKIVFFKSIKKIEVIIDYNEEESIATKERKDMAMSKKALNQLKKELNI